MLLPLITIKQANIGFSNKPVLSNIDLQICKGQHIAFIGESGSGKTLLLQAIAGNVQLISGNITRHFIQLGNITKCIAFVAARHHFHNLSNTADLYYQQRYNSNDSVDTLTVSVYLQQIEVSATLTHYWDIDKVIALLKLAPLADKQLIKLSNGETKRLLIAAALLKNPLLLILDNPLAGLDEKTRAYFEIILDAIAASGITIVMAAGLQEIPNLITYIGVINNGGVEVTTHNEFRETENALRYYDQNKIDFADLLSHYPAPAFHTIVDMQNVNIQYGEKQVLNKVSWQINQGERWALLGPNGAGKSTLLSLINGDNPQAYANNITLFDRKRGSGESIWDIKKKTGFLSPELYQYFPINTLCVQVVESGFYDTIGLFRPSVPAKVAKAMQWLKIMDIDNYAQQPLKNIPAGAQRLCLLARAMIKCPVLLILDEPTQGMDERQVQHFKHLINAICQITNITLIYVTHYTHHIPDSVTKTLKLEAGLVVS